MPLPLPQATQVRRRGPGPQEAEQKPWAVAHPCARVRARTHAEAGHVPTRPPHSASHPTCMVMVGVLSPPAAVSVV